jgi:hypothetical protein
MADAADLWGSSEESDYLVKLSAEAAKSVPSGLVAIAQHFNTFISVFVRSPPRH